MRSRELPTTDTGGLRGPSPPPKGMAENKLSPTPIERNQQAGTTGTRMMLYPNAQMRFCLIFLSVALPSRRPPHRTTCLLSERSPHIRTPPLPLARPSSAAQAGASFTPSYRSQRPCLGLEALHLLLPSRGVNPARTSDMPTFLATASAVVRSSPVSIMTLSPMEESSRPAASASARPQPRWLRTALQLKH